MKSKFKCPACENPLVAQELFDGSWQLWCGNPRCCSHVSQYDGGSGKTSEVAYRSLCAAVDNECEQEMDFEAKKERDKDVMAERLGDRLDRGQ